MASRNKVARTVPIRESEIVPSISSLPRFYWCQMKAEVDEIDFRWTIERFVFFDDGEKCFTYTTPEFDNKFKLSLIANGNEVRIDLLSSTVLGYPIRVEISIMKEKCEKIEQRTKTILTNAQFPIRVYEKSKQELLKSVNLTEEITISCKITSLKRKQQMVKVRGTERYPNETITVSYQDLILQQLEEMFKEMPLSDFTFNIRGRKFPAHKTILAMRSPVFAAMFHHPTKEVLSSQVEVEDIDPDVFQEVLRFIYTDKTQLTAMNQVAPGLLAAADKYLLEDLKFNCENHLIRQMSAENCLELLSLTVHHPAEHLKKYAIQYFRRYPDDVMKTDNWKKLKEENPAALCDLQQMVLSAAPAI